MTAQHFHKNPPAYLFWTVSMCKQCLICVYFSPDWNEMTFPLEKAMLLIEEAVYNGFVYYKHAAFCFTVHSLLDWHRVDYFWIIVIFFISCLDSRSDGTHSLQSNAIFLQICTDEETNSFTSWIAWEGFNFQKKNFFGWTIFLIN